MAENITAVDYFELAYEHKKGACSVKFLKNRTFNRRLKNGDRLADEWPADMTFSMNPDKPKDVALIDYIHNLEGALLASPRLIEFLRGQGLPDVEFLPVTILDHKNRIASKEYAIVNCCRVIDCVDQQHSEFEWDGLTEPSMIVSKLVVNQAVLPEDARLIRPKFVPGKVLYRSDLRQSLSEQGFTGLSFSRELFGDYNVY